MGRDTPAVSDSGSCSIITPRTRNPTPQKPPLHANRSQANGARSSSAAGTPAGTPRGTAARPWALPPRLDLGSGVRLGGCGVKSGGSLPSSPRSYRAASSITSESVGLGNLEELLSTMEESRGADNVKVIVRVRPLSEREQRSEAGGRQCVAVVGDRTLVLTDPTRCEPFSGTFDHVLGAAASQEDVYRVAGEAVVENCMNGFNSSIFAYGQTGSGKTYTMQGALDRWSDGRLSEQCGLIVRVFEHLFQRISEEEQEKGRDTLRYSVKCSYLEIYNEVITDLLKPEACGLNIRDGDLKRGVFVEDLSETHVLNAEDVVALMQRGSANRHMAETKMNHESSRSHSVFTCTIEAHERIPESGITNIRYSKLNLIDLAGSERVGKSGATGERLTEAQSINRSLTTLGRVISALVERQKRPATHVPYRDSRLTFLLQESLGGNSKTCIIANVSPSAESVQETHSTLLFAAGAKRIRNKAVVNTDTQGDVRALQLENARLSRLLEEARASGRSAAADEARIAELTEQLHRAELREREQHERAARLETVFDQSNAVISQLQAEHSVAKKELDQSKANTARLTQDTVQLRSDNHALSNELAQLREEQEQERELHEDHIAEMRQDMEAMAAQLQSAECAAEALRWEVQQATADLAREQQQAQQATADLAREQQQAQQLQKVLEEERDERRRAQAAAEASAAERRRVQRQAEEDSERHREREARLQQDNQELYKELQAMRSEFQSLKKELAEEALRVTKYKRMASEIGNLVNSVQANSPRLMGGMRGGGGSVAPSPLAGGTRFMRLSLGLGPNGGNADLPSPSAASPLALRPLGDATNRSGSGAAAGRVPPLPLHRSPTKQPRGGAQGVGSSPAARSMLASPAALR